MKLLLCYIFLIIPTIARSQFQESACANAGGICQRTDSECGGNFITGKCPRQPANVKCCVQGSSGDRQPFQEQACANSGGICQSTSMGCDGEFVTGKCPTQPTNVKCCVGSGAAGGGDGSGGEVGEGGDGGAGGGGQGSDGGDGEEGGEGDGEGERSNYASSCNAGGNKYSDTMNLVFGNEGKCQNSAADRGNVYKGRRGYTCMGITPGVGYENRNMFPDCSGFSGQAANFVKWCYDRNTNSFKAGATEIYKSKYFNVCDNLEQPAFYVCADISVNSGPGKAREFLRKLGSPGSDMKSYARKLNEMHRQLYQRLGGPNMRGWLLRADRRDAYINSC